MNTGNFLNLFPFKKPILAMIHLKGNSQKEKVGIAQKEIDLLIDNGIDGVIIENYFGNIEDLEEVLRYVSSEREDIVYGVNALRHDSKAFDLANLYKAKFIQIDSVAGHLNEVDDQKFNEFIKNKRSESDAYVLGGVHFKYQPYLSGRSLEEDLRIGTGRSDGIVVTGSGTGIETDLDKINHFKEIIGKDFPLMVGAGLNANNCYEQLSIADGGIIGSYLKNTQKDDGDVSEEQIKLFMDEVRKLRKSKFENN
jgi:predicted TIM-barrel enzyme